MGGAILVKIHIGDTILKNTGNTVILPRLFNKIFNFKFVDFVGIR